MCKQRALTLIKRKVEICISGMAAQSRLESESTWKWAPPPSLYLFSSCGWLWSVHTPQALFKFYCTILLNILSSCEITKCMLDYLGLWLEPVGLSQQSMQIHTPQTYSRSLCITLCRFATKAIQKGKGNIFFSFKLIQWRSTYCLHISKYCQA